MQESHRDVVHKPAIGSQVDGVREQDNTVFPEAYLQPDKIIKPETVAPLTRVCQGTITTPTFR